MLFRLLSNLVMYWYLMLVQDLATETAKEYVFFQFLPRKPTVKQHNRPVLTIKLPENRPHSYKTDPHFPENRPHSYRRGRL